MAALTRIEGFDWIDHFSYVYAYSGTPTTSSANTRFGAGRLASLVSGDKLIIPIHSASNGVMGFAWRNSSIGTSTANIVQLYGGSQNGHQSMALKVRSDGKLEIVDALGTALGSASTSTVTSNTWYYIEWQYDLANSTTYANTVKVDGITWINLTAGSDTLNDGQPSQGIDKLVFQGHTNGTSLVDDVYASYVASGFLGDMQIVSLVPTGDNFDLSNTWTNSAGNQTSNYGYVDETGNPDDDTTYVFTTGDEQLEMYRMSNLGVTANEIFGIELITRAKKSGAGDMYIGQNYLTNSAVNEATTQQLGASYAYIRTIVEQNPDTSNNFTSSEVDNLHFGSKSYTGTL